jgi:hypothetical protein
MFPADLLGYDVGTHAAPCLGIMALLGIRPLGILMALGALAIACASSDDSPSSKNKLGNDDDRDYSREYQQNQPQPQPTSAVCNATTCAEGCCLAGQCFTDHSANHCASGGVLCPAPCAVGVSCVRTNMMYSCGVGTGSRYEVTLVSATVRQAGDTAPDLPDVYINKGTFGTLTIEKTETVDNVLAATFNARVGVIDATALNNARITVEVKDNDRGLFAFDDKLGDCTHTVTPAEVSAGVVTIQDAECTDHVASVTFALKPSM